MMLSNVIGAVGGITSIIGLVLLLWYARKSSSGKRIFYGISENVPLASAFSTDVNRFTVLYGPKGEQEEVQAAFLTEFRFANFGRDSIRAEDFVPRNPVRLLVEGCKVLDISMSGVAREVNGIRLKKAETDDDRAVVEVLWDYLDHKDGARLRVLSDGRPKNIEMVGDIVGMPQGIQNIKVASASGRQRLITTLTLVFVLISLGAWNTYLYKWVLGTWSHVWLLLTPVLTIFLFFVISFIVMQLVIPERRGKWAPNLSFMPWYMPRLVTIAFTDSPDLYDRRRVTY
jgi:hypothetical protein